MGDSYGGMTRHKAIKEIRIVSHGMKVEEGRMPSFQKEFPHIPKFRKGGFALFSIDLISERKAQCADHKIDISAE